MRHLNTGHADLYRMGASHFGGRTLNTDLSNFVQEAKVLLDSSLDYERTLVRVAELAVPRLADTCFVDVLTPDGSTRRVDAVANDPHVRERLRVITRQYPPREYEPVGMVLRTGEPLFVSEVPDEMLALVAHSDEHLSVLKKNGPRSAMAIPLSARGRVLGVISFLHSRWATPARHYSQADFENAKQFAQIAALAVDNARVYGELHHRARAAVEEVKRLTDALMKELEEDRRRIARDLHDGMGQRLAALRMQLERVQKETGSASLCEALKGCEELRHEMHRVIYDLKPPELESACLADILRDHSEQFELRTGIATSFRASGDDIRDPDAASALLRILQESLTNSARHGKATEVGIVLVTFNGIATLEIADDGGGFDPNNAVLGHGLRSMRERVKFLGGEVQVKSRPGSGTAITARVPIQQELS